MEKIVFNPQGEDETVFYILEQTRINGIDYLLVTDVEEGDGEALILRDYSAQEDTESEYRIVSDDNEFDVVADVFASLLDDVDLEK